ncbi:MAG: sulfite exporter TauE/SafE family protein [Candidatus Paceibacterota bacterium]|jgi:sulfite exporter TauE/SafE/copper chaperone CopZ
MNKVTVPIKGMHCRSCELLVEEALKDVPGVKNVEVNYRTGKADLYFKKGIPSQGEAIYNAVKNIGYDVGYKNQVEWISKDENDYNNLLNGIIILIIIFFVAKFTGILDYSVNSENVSYPVVLMVGLVAGVSTCMALVGGLVLSISAQHAEAHPEITSSQKFRPHLFFNLGRIAGFGIFGGILAMIGSAFQPSPGSMGLMTIIIGGVMIFLGLKLIEIFPFMKDITISLPKGISKALGIKREQKEYSHKGAAITGALTFFLPCGFTQAMQLYAVGSGGFVNGALIMSLFALGTAPGLLGIGGLSSMFKGKNARTFFATTGLAVIILGWINITNGSQLVFQGKADSAIDVASSSLEVQEVKMTQGNTGYTPNVLTVEKGKKVRWIITSTNQFSCASSIVMPKYGISKSLKKGENVIEFVPKETGEIPFSCSMGMYRGKFIVVEPGSGAGASNSSPSPSSDNVQAQAGGSCGSGGGGCGCGGGAKKNIDPVATQPQAKTNEGQIIKADYTLSKDIVPNNFEVKKGVPVRFEIDVKEDGQGCMSSVMVPGLYNSAQYLEGGKKMVMEFTPEKAGDYNITCAMGVPRGVIKVVN